MVAMDLDQSISQALSTLDARGRKRAAASSMLTPITDEMPLGLQLHLAKMGAPDHRTPPEGSPEPAGGMLSQRSPLITEREHQPDTAE